jgi:TatA/E family protein of Tat protein translocase
MLKLLLLLLLGLLIFGGSRLSKIGRDLGLGIRAFRRGLDGRADDPPQEPTRVEVVKRAERSLGDDLDDGPSVKP